MIKNYNYFLNFIEYIKNMSDTPTLQEFSNICSNNFFCLEEMISSIKTALSTPLSNYFYNRKKTQEFLDCIIDDLIIELWDNCALHTNQETWSSSTAAKNLASNRTYATLSKNIILQNEELALNYWPLFLTSNTSIENDKHCYISKFGGPAVISTLDMMDSKNIFPPKSGLDYSTLESLRELLYSTLDEKKLTWKTEYPEENNFVQELAYYHLEKMWRINYTSEVLKSYQRINVGYSIYPAIRESNQPNLMYMQIKKEDMEISDYECILETLKIIEKSSPNMQTNLFLINYYLTSRFDPINLSKNDSLDYITSDFLPSIRNFLYYSIMKSCIKMEITGEELYYSIKDYCNLHAIKAIKKRYKVPEYSAISITKLEATFTTKIIKEISKIIYPDPDLILEEHFKIKELRKYVNKRNNFSNKICYDSEIFKNLYHINDINPTLTTEE